MHQLHFRLAQQYNVAFMKPFLNQSLIYGLIFSTIPLSTTNDLYETY